MRESEYQAALIKKIRHELLPGSMVLKNDSGYIQGIPDLSIFFEDRWAMLEVKTSEDAPEGPNQRHYIELTADMSFASFIYPENERRVLFELQSAFNYRR